MSNANRDRVKREREDRVCADCNGILRWQVRQYRHMHADGHLYITTHAPKPIEAPVCPRCGRELRPWPLERGDKCSPKRWAYCTRPVRPKPLGGE